MTYTYLHLLIVAGIIVSAVADELTLRHPQQRTDVITAAVLLGGPALYLLGNALFKQTVNRTNLPLSHLVGLAPLAVLALTFAWWPIAALGVATTVVLLAVAIWEMRSLRHVRELMEERSHS